MKRSTLGSLLAKSTATNVNEKRGNVTDRKQKKAPTLTLGSGRKISIETQFLHYKHSSMNTKMRLTTFCLNWDLKWLIKIHPIFLSCITGRKNATSHACLFWNHWPEKGDTNTHILLCSVVTDRKKPNTQILLWSLTAKNTKRGTV